MDTQNEIDRLTAVQYPIYGFRLVAESFVGKDDLYAHENDI